MNKYCIWCNILINKSRLEVLPDTETCVNCSEEQKSGYTIIGMSPSLGEIRKYVENGHVVNDRDMAMLGLLNSN